MLKFFINRLLLAIITIFLIVTITFFVMHAIPGNPFIGTKTVNPEIIKNLEIKYKLDKPMHEQYCTYIKDIIKFDFGNSLYYENQSVIKLIKNGLEISSIIGCISAVFSLFLGILLGSISAIKENSGFDKFIRFMVTFFTSLPSFTIGVILLWTFGVWAPLFPTNGTEPASLIMPILALSLYPTAYIVKIMRTSTIDILSKDYIKAAYIRGIPKYKILYKYTLKNAITPVISYGGPMITYLITGSFVIEKIFSISGIGSLFVTSIQNSDYPVIMGITIVLAILNVVGSILCDLLYKIIDKRVELI